MTTEQLKKCELEIGCWYVGRGRNANVGKWMGNGFLVLSEELVYRGSFQPPHETRPAVKIESYYTEAEGCFQPFRKIDEGIMVAPFGVDGWGAHYGRTLQFDGVQP